MHAEQVGTARSRKIGLIAIFLVWVTTAVVNSLAKILNENGISAEEILVFRSVLCILVALSIAGFGVLKVSFKVMLAGFVMALSGVAFYRAIEVWQSVNSVAVVVAFMPVVNIVIGLFEGKRVSGTVIISMTCLILGVVIALEPWSQPISIPGLLWAISCVIISGIGFEMWGREPETVTISQKCFWLSIWALGMSLAIIGFSDNETLCLAKYADMRLVKILVAFAIPVTIYLFLSIVPFSRVGKMNVVTATILIQGCTPATLIGSYFLVGERLSLHQWSGVAVALIGASFLSVQTIKTSKPSEFK
ncbi:MAG: hypothetical protein NT077_02100 [Candidatus Taylorbacteria bacterium]|nr:hypothetical protein [Candidatus Taylorbacteria bacterium]